MSQTQLAYLALGTNLGDRAANIHAALDALSTFVTVEETAFLYETPPAYVTDQPAFLNTACRIRTALSPLELLRALKVLEAELGRQESVRYGPRLIDVDILFYADLVLESAEVTTPHPRLAERDFVLEPLCDLAPDLRHPQLNVTVHELWQALDPKPLPRVMPTAGQLWRWGEKTYVMGIINVTPDSFSGDGLAQHEKWVEMAVEQGQRFAAEGADVLDVGGYSTRPDHVDIPVEEEIRRVEPVIQALAQATDLPISVDTFRAPVAEVALAAGAHWINDVWGLQIYPELADLAARHHAALVIMHNRSQPLPPYHHRLAATKGKEYTDLIAEMQQELAASLVLARQAGVPRWQRIVDPGMGFGKTLEHHLEIIDRLAELKVDGAPLLFGSSRKGFIGHLLGGLPREERLEGTLATNILAADRGANIVRVHDVKATARALRVADAVMRRRWSSSDAVIPAH